MNGIGVPVRSRLTQTLNSTQTFNIATVPEMTYNVLSGTLSIYTTSTTSNIDIFT